MHAPNRVITCGAKFQRGPPDLHGIALNGQLHDIGKPRGDGDDIRNGKLENVDAHRAGDLRSEMRVKRLTWLSGRMNDIHTVAMNLTGKSVNYVTYGGARAVCNGHVNAMGLARRYATRPGAVQFAP
ncbi:hypothetical protein L0938_02645 [Paracidovorax citrulli]